jgi:hypothetical protein
MAKFSTVATSAAKVRLMTPPCDLPLGFSEPVEGVLPL